MSQTETRAASETRIRQLLADDFDPWEKSRQAVYHDRNGREPFGGIDRHDDGEAMFREFGMKPFHKVLERAERDEHPAYTFPASYLNAVIHVDDAEIYALERGDLGYFDDAPRTRQRVMQWLARDGNEEILEILSDGGREIHAHAKPGKGKTSFANVIGTIRNAEVNNDTVMWCLTLDELEVLPVAPWMTACVPEGVKIDVEAKPKDYRLPSASIALGDVFRDVIEYSDPVDLFEKVVPGGIYGVFPDPKFRKCEKLTLANYNTAWEADEPGDVTPLRDFTHALLEVRARRDVFLHPTTLVIDEFGDLCPKNPEADASDTHRKVTEYPKRLGKMRKKNGSVIQLSHSLKRIHEDVLEKTRWFATMPQTPTPSSGLSGIGEVPLPDGYTRSMAKGQAAVWNATNYAPISWTNPYRRYDFVGEIAISYPEMEGALNAI
jgi:hypothetical protein